MQPMIIFVTMILFSITTYACPDLTGKYQCYDDDVPFTVTINYNSTKKTYDFNNEHWVADGSESDYISQGVVGKKRIFCKSESTLVLDLVGDFYNSRGEIFGQFDVQNDFSLEGESSETLVWQQSGFYRFDFDGAKREAWDLKKCSRL